MNKIFYLFAFLVFINCDKKETISGSSIVKKSIEKHGGINSWNSLKKLSFDKRVVLFLEDGSIENESLQHQEYTFLPELEGQISWKKQLDVFLITYKNGEIKKYLNDSLISDVKELQSAKNSFFASQYVTTKPFDLLSSKTKLIYTKIKEFEGKRAYEVKVEYENDTEKSDVWFYYFDVNTFKVIANKVVLSDHTSLVDNHTFNTETEFIFNEHRKSYRLNELGEKTFLRAEYFYSNYKTSF